MREPVIFDLDGTLVDSIADIAASMNHVLAAAGFPRWSLAQYAAFVGDGAPALVRRAAPNDADVATLLREFVAHYGEHALDATRPYPGVPELVDDLRRAEHPLAVLSNKPDPLTRRIVAACFAADTFDIVLGDRPGVPRKPDPGAAIEIAVRLHVAPAACWLVGDTPVDVRTAKAAGMRSVAVTWGLRAEPQLRAAAPDHLVRTVAELSALLLQPPHARG